MFVSIRKPLFEEVRVVRSGFVVTFVVSKNFFWLENIISFVQDLAR